MAHFVFGIPPCGAISRPNAHGDAFRHRQSPPLHVGRWVRGKILTWPITRLVEKQGFFEERGGKNMMPICHSDLYERLKNHPCVAFHPPGSLPFDRPPYTPVNQRVGGQKEGG